jgi:xanthine dehydrogenase YagS FAD-binding subunit
LPTEDHRSENTLRPGELVTHVWLPRADGVRSTYRKAMNRKVWAFALVGVAAALRLRDGRAHDVRLVLSGVAPIPWRALAAERVLEDAALDDSAITRAAEEAVAEARPLGLNGYKVPLARGLIQQALRGLRSG